MNYNLDELINKINTVHKNYWIEQSFKEEYQNQTWNDFYNIIDAWGDFYCKYSIYKERINLDKNPIIKKSIPVLKLLDTLRKEFGINWEKINKKEYKIIIK